MPKCTRTITNQDILDLRIKGLTYTAIAALSGISRARVHQLCSGYNPTYKNVFGRLRETIKRRDNFKCQWGKKCDNKKLVVHHIDFNDRNNNPSNLITLCNKCHGGFHATNHVDKSIEDRLRNPLRIKKEKVLYEKKCKFCAEKFKTLREQAVFCGHSCANKFTKGHFENIKRNKEIKRMFLSGISPLDIAKKVGLQRISVYKILSGKR